MTAREADGVRLADSFRSERDVEVVEPEDRDDIKTRCCEG